jgi:hypothetical protein
MKRELNEALKAVKEAELALMKASKEAAASKDLFKLTELNDCVDDFCKKTPSTKGEICLLADISSSTLTAALKNPEKATMTTISSIASVIGLEILIGRHNGSV